MAPRLNFGGSFVLHWLEKAAALPHASATGGKPGWPGPAQRVRRRRLVCRRVVNPSVHHVHGNRNRLIGNPAAHRDLYSHGGLTVVGHEKALFSGHLPV
jgi:hypothetical protein